MTSRPSNSVSQNAELILYGLAAAGVCIFGLAIAANELFASRNGSVRLFYALALILICVLGFAMQLAFRRKNAIRAASWIVLGLVLVDATCFVFLYAYTGSVPVPRSMSPFRQYVFHPSLVALPRPNAHGRMFLDEIAYAYSHNDVGARGTQNFDPSKMSILAIGGSTTYEIGVDDAETWPAYLSEKLSTRFNVLNFGVNSHSTAQHIIFTALRASTYNPRCIIYYVGWNDIRNSHLSGLQPDYSDFALLDQYDELGVINRYHSWWAIGSLVRMVSFAVLEIPRARKIGRVEAQSDPRLEKIFRRNVRLLAVIAKAIGARPIFIPQVLNDASFAEGAGPSAVAWVPFVDHRAVPAVMRRFNGILREEAEKEEVAFLDAPMAHAWKPSDFLDEGHFTAAGSKTFSDLIAPEVIKQCE